ncbi:MAG: RadC family protein [Suipraeoptans sp.]
MNKNVCIREMQSSELPYEKFAEFGSSGLTDLELLAVIIRTGSKGLNILELCETLLYGNGHNGLIDLHQYTYESLMRIKGIGRVKAAQLQCLTELMKRLSKATAKEPLCFNNPRTIANYYMEELRHLNQEILKLLLLNTKSGLIAERNISKGTVNASLITPREIFIEALSAKAVSIILLHNHPSGDAAPSRDDVRITNRIKEAGLMLGVELLDHIVIGNNTYTSFKEEGFL